MRSVWINLIFLWKRYDLRGKAGYKYYGMYMLFILATVISAIMTVIVPAMAVEDFTAGKAIWRVLLSAALLGLNQTVKEALNTRIYIVEMKYRGLETANSTNYLMSLPAEDIQGPLGQELFGTISQAVFYGNDNGTEGFMHNFWDFITALISTVVYIIMSLRLEWYWLPLILTPSLVRGILTWRYNQYAKSKDSLEQELFMKRRYLEKMTLRNEAAKDYRLFPMKRLFFEKFKENREGFMALEKDLNLRLFIRDAVGIALELIRDVLCFIILLDRVEKGMPISQFVLYYGVILSLGSYVHSCFENLGKLMRNNVIVSNFRNVFNRKAYDQGEWMEHIPSDIPEICFEDVWYRYDDNSPWVLKAVNLVIHPGEKIALVGENGAGKTTLVKLACGLLTPVQGRVLINGVDLQKVNPKERYNRATLVFQEVLIFAMTVGENICCCPEGDIDEERLWRAIEQAGLKETIEALPSSFRTPMTRYVDSKGIELSGGQNQRLMLARALYKGGDLLVLDEPTSALDPLAEAALYEEYYSFAKGQTAVFISHRLSSTQFCDRLLFLKNGEIVQSGSHQQLAAKEGPYQTMFRTQAKYYQEEVLS